MSLSLHVFGSDVSFVDAQKLVTVAELTPQVEGEVCMHTVAGNLSRYLASLGGTKSYV